MVTGKAFLAVAAILGLVMAGCASTLHPERVNQPVEKRGDVDIPLAIGNLAVPGGTLFLIHDIRNGAIYKPKVDPAAAPAPAAQ